MKKALILLCVVVMVIGAIPVLAVEYDEDKVVDVMKANGAAMGAIQNALKDENFFAAAEALMTIATTMKSLEGMDPPKGDKAEWDTNHATLIKAALKGIGACGEEDAEKVNMYVGEIGKLIKEGHGMFK